MISEKMLYQLKCIKYIMYMYKVSNVRRVLSKISTWRWSQLLDRTNSSYLALCTDKGQVILNKTSCLMLS